MVESKQTTNGSEKMSSGTFDTTLGRVKYVFTDATHAFLEEADRDEPLVVHSVAYHVSLHLYRQPDGSWGTKSKDNGSEFGNLYMIRVPYSAKEPSEAARKKVLAVILVAFSEIATYDLRIQAEIDSTQEKVDRNAEEIERIERELSDARLQGAGLGLILTGLKEGSMARREVAIGLDWTRYQEDTK
jgi:hypothetical protein